jgi:single-strand DNA-binding protein
MSANISILGNAGRDVSLRYKENGTAVASFPIASNSFKKSPEGRVQVTHWFDVTAFGKTAETLAEHVKKGTYLLIHGRLSFNPWSTEKNEPRSGAQVALFSFEFAGGNRSEEQEAGTPVDDTAGYSTPEYSGPEKQGSQTPEPFENQF